MPYETKKLDSTKYSYYKKRKNKYTKRYTISCKI